MLLWRSANKALLLATLARWLARASNKRNG
jgi:hypothetical protein